MTPLDSALPLQTILSGGSADAWNGLRLPGIVTGKSAPATAPHLLQTALEEALAKLQAQEAMIAEQQERIAYLETLSLSDELTGLINRRGFQAALRRELAAADRSGTGGVLVMIDLDGFKAINDTHGHLAGDAYLRRIGQVLAEGVRAQDVVARLGGDEFAILLTRVDGEAGLARAHSLAERLNGQTFTWGGKTLPLRASFGAEPYQAGDRADAILRRADQTMYKVKGARKRRAA